MADQAATFNINLESNATSVSTEDAAALEQLRAKMNASTDAIKLNISALRTLRGQSDDVKAAREQLKAKLDAERTSLSAASLSLLKQGASLDVLNRKSEAATKVAAELANAQKNAGDAVAYAGGPIDSLRSKLSSLSELLSTGNAGSLLLVAGMAALAAGAVALGAAVGVAAASLSRFAVVEADANRSLQLSRQWIAGSAADSARMGDQIDRLRQKIPLTTAEFSKLYASTRAGFDGARASGKDILNIVEAVGSAQAAGAENAAAKLREIGERGKVTGRVRVDTGWNAFSGGPGGKGELAGTGLDPDTLAAGVAAAMKVSLEKAKTLLRTTGVDMATYAKAAVFATNKAFGEINAEKLLSLDPISNRLRDDWSSLTKGINLKPFLEGLDRVEKTFSTSTTSGYALKQMFTSMGVVLGGISGTSAPLLETAIRVVILETVKMSNEFLRAEIFLKKTFGKGSLVGPETLHNVIVATKLAVGATVVVLGTLAVAMAVATKGAYDLAKPFILAAEGARKLVGLVSGGIGSSASTAAGPGTVTTPSSIVPSAGPGTVTAPANADGGVIARPAPGEFFASVAPGERIVPANDGGGSHRGGPISVTVPISIQAHGASGHAVAQAIQSSGLVAQITKAIEDALKGAGVPTQAVPG